VESVYFHQITWYHVPEDDGNIHCHPYENLGCKEILLYCIVYPYFVLIVNLTIYVKLFGYVIMMKGIPNSVVG
jgi:hypothetical protein